MIPQTATEKLRNNLETTDSLLNELLGNLKKFQNVAQDKTMDYSWAETLAHVNNRISEINEFLKPI